MHETQCLKKKVYKPQVVELCVVLARPPDIHSMGAGEATIKKPGVQVVVVDRDEADLGIEQPLWEVMVPLCLI